MCRTVQRAEGTNNERHRGGSREGARTRTRPKSRPRHPPRPARTGRLGDLGWPRCWRTPFEEPPRPFTRSRVLEANNPTYPRAWRGPAGKTTGQPARLDCEELQSEPKLIIVFTACVVASVNGPEPGFTHLDLNSIETIKLFI